jgi:hypothetical protein
MSTHSITAPGIITTTREPTTADGPETSSAAVGPGTRIPRWAVPAVALLAALGFAALIVAGWRYVITSNEATESQDWDQLVGLIDRAGSIVLFILGALFGIAIQARHTAETKVAVDKNRAEADKQHAAAQANAETATHNKEAARGQAELVEDTVRVLRDVREVVNGRRWDDSVFLHGPGVRLDGRKVVGRVRMLEEGDQHGVLEDAEASPIDPRIDALADEIDRAIEKANANRLRVI